jgi:hypothetical protein
VSGRHREGLAGSGSLRAPITIAGVVALIAFAALAVRAVAADARGCDSDIRLTVAVAPDLEPAIRAVADRWSRTNPKVNNQCVNVQVRAAEPADIANLLASRAGGTINVAAEPAPTPSEADIPVVWIPDSTAWLLRMQPVNRDAVEPDARSVAMTPVVFGVPEQIGGGFFRRVSAQEIPALLQRVGSGELHLVAAEPRRTTASLVGAALLRDAIATDPKKLVELVKAYRAVEVVPDTGALLDGFAPNQLAPLTEQAILTASPAVPLGAVPIEPAVALDYPYAKITGKSRGAARAADLFLTALTSGDNQDVFHRHGFRSPDGAAGQDFPAGRGATAGQVTAQAFTDVGKLEDVLGLWIATKSPSRVLTLIDLTSSMNSPMVVKAGAATRLDVLRKTASDGLRLFSDDSELGLWAFGGPDHRQVVPVDALDASQRARLNAAVSAAATAPTDECGLYEAVLAAYKALQSGYRERRSNTVVVFTDGRNTKPGMTLEQLQLELERATDVTRPIRVVLLGIGPDADQAELDTIAKQTGGRAFSVQDPEQIGNIFLEALLRT